MKIIIIFTILTILNVIFSTIRTLLTFSKSKFIASISNGLYFGYYAIVLVYMVSDFPLVYKVIITAVCNFVGVYIVKYFEQKFQKDKNKKFEITFNSKYTNKIKEFLTDNDYSYNYISINKYVIFNVYEKDRGKINDLKNLIKLYNGKYNYTELNV